MQRTSTKRTSTLLFGILLLAGAAFAQSAMPKPGPEVKKLDYFTGHWTSEADVKPGPEGPGGKYHSDDHMEWMEGGFFVVIHAKFNGGGFGPGSSTAYMGYDPQEKVYTYDEFNSMGEATHSKGTVDGDTWTWVNEWKMGAKTMKGRYTEKILSPTAYSYKYEASSDGTNWTLWMDGKETKVK
ncbi:MAG: DUF1579 family protein [Terriglobales bacterium]